MTLNPESLLPIYSICSESYREVHAVFRASLEAIDYPAEKVVTLFYDDSDVVARGFQTPSWYFAIQEKLRFILSQVRAHPGQFIIASDVDIQFFPPFRDVDLGRVMEKHGLDLLFMREVAQEEPSINGGFIVIRCTADVARLMEAVLERISQEQLPYADQTAFTEALRGGCHPVRVDTIHQSKVIWGLVMPAVVSDAWFHHAVCCYTNPEKLAQFEVVRAAVSACPRGFAAIAQRMKTRCRRLLGQERIVSGSPWQRDQVSAEASKA